MRSLIKMEMSRYPVVEVALPSDVQSNQAQARRLGAATHHSSRAYHQREMIYGPRKEGSEEKKEGVVMPDGRREKSIEKYISELTNEVEESYRHPEIGDSKFKVLQRIIEHYDIKSMEKKNYSKIIKTFGLQIGTAQTTERGNTSQDKRRNFTIKPATTRASTRRIRLKNRLDGDGERQVALLQFSRQLVPSHQRIRTPNSQIFNKSTLEKSSDRPSLRVVLSKDEQLEKSKKMSPLKFKSKQDVVVEKVNKYREFLFALNYSNGLYRDMKIHCYERPLKFYVGAGNNSNLVKSLLRKRHYFEETTKIKEAHFVWTQIKVEQIFEHQQPFKPSMKQESLHRIQSPEKDKRFPIKQGLILNNDNLARILVKKEAKELLQIHDDASRKGYPCDFELKAKLLPRSLFHSSISEADKVHNHIPSNGLLGNKKGLFHCMRQYYKLTGRNIWDILPLTFHITTGMADNQFKQFQQYFSDRKKKRLPNCWIMKPGQFSNRGNGITCSKKIDDIKKRVMKCHGGRNGRGAQTLILQLYITNPLLYNNRKFDIRTFMLVTCHNGKIKAYWYQEGYVRTSSHLFNLNEMADIDIHLTNDAIQKQSESYGRYEPGNKLSYQELQRYFDSLPAQGRNLDIQSELIPRMKSICTEAVKSSFLFLDEKRLQNNFEVFGLDFMIDWHFNPWLIEINTNPCLELSCPLLERILPHMVENALRIGLDPIFPPPEVVPHNYKFNIAENAMHYNRFQLIFDETRDGPKVKALYEESPNVAATVSSLMNIQQDQEVFEEEGVMCDFAV